MSEARELPSIKEIYPHKFNVKDDGDKWGVGLRVIKWLESQGYLINQNFYFDTKQDREHVQFRFRKRKVRAVLEENLEEAIGYEGPGLQAS